MSKHTPKPCELFPDAVVLYNGKPATWFTWDTVDSHDLIQGDIVRDVRTKELTPLPISPAVLRGLGFEFDDESDAYVYAGLAVYSDGLFWKLDGGNEPILLEFTHHFQALCIHLYGVELTWNQSEYETALQEEAK